MRKLALYLMFFALPLVAQVPKPATLVASILDKHGNAPAAALEPNLVISENGKETKARSAERLSNPILYVVLVDSSGSADTDSMRQVLKELPGFFRRVLRPQDKVTVIGFSEQATSEIEPTSDIETIRKALSNLSWHGKTALFDSMVDVCTRTLPKLSPSSERKVAILLTDGDDSASRSHEDAALTAAGASHATFYPIDIRFGLKMWAGEFVQQDLANETGGKFFQFGSVKALENSLQEIQNLVANQFLVEYLPEADAGKKPAIKVKADGQPDLRVIAPKHRFD